MNKFFSFPLFPLLPLLIVLLCIGAFGFVQPHHTPSPPPPIKTFDSKYFLERSGLSKERPLIRIEKFSPVTAKGYINGTFDGLLTFNHGHINGNYDQQQNNFMMLYCTIDNQEVVILKVPIEQIRIVVDNKLKHPLFKFDFDLPEKIDEDRMNEIIGNLHLKTYQYMVETLGAKVVIRISEEQLNKALSESK